MFRIDSIVLFGYFKRFILIRGSWWCVGWRSFGRKGNDVWLVLSLEYYRDFRSYSFYF